MKKRYFIVKWYEPYGIVDDMIFKVLVIANSQEEAENKVRTVKKVKGTLYTEECMPIDGIIFLGAE